VNQPTDTNGLVGSDGSKRKC